MKEGCTPEDWQSSLLVPVYRGKGDPFTYDSYKVIKLLEDTIYSRWQRF